MHFKVSDISIVALLAMLLFCGAAHSESIPLIHEQGTLQVPVIINGKISLHFTIDSGATDVSIPANVFFSLTREGTVSPQDFLDKRAIPIGGRIHRILPAISHSILASRSFGTPRRHRVGRSFLGIAALRAELSFATQILVD